MENNHHPPEFIYNFDPTQIGRILITGQSRAGKISYDFINENIQEITFRIKQVA